MSNSQRLDQFLVDAGLFPSRARAQGAIRAGLISVDGAVIDKPAASVREGAAVKVAGDVHDYVSRGGVKLEAALRSFAIDPEAKICLDLGASTGGFTDALLRRGAAKIYAVDVGKGQLHPAILSDARVVNLEKTHARDLSGTLIADPIDIIACDVSFISLKQVLPYAMALASPNARMIALIKPQFEVGRSQIGKGGIVKQIPENSAGVTTVIEAWVSARQGWKSLGVIDSPILGGDGNKEFLIGAIKSA